jgi:hypothetical protein
MAGTMVSEDPLPLPEEVDVLLPRGWAEARQAQLAADGEDEPNVLRGLD